MARVTTKMLLTAEAMLKEGKGYREAAEAVGCSEASIRCYFPQYVRKTGKKHNWIYPKIDQWARKNNVTIEAMAEEMDIAPQTLGTYLTGYYKMPYKHKKRLAELIGGTVHDLF